MQTSENPGSARPFVIAVGVDFSVQSKYAIELARSIAHGQSDVMVHAVHVAGLPGLLGVTNHIDVGHELERVREVCAPVAGELASCMLCHVVIGRADRELVRFACECGADMLIIGGRERSGIERLVTGSMSGRIVRSAPCSVLVARGDVEHEPLDDDDEEEDSREAPNQEYAPVG